MTHQRLDRDRRRRAILEAVVPVFAEKGFHGVRTRELAAAAGISEALLYRHFPSKDDLYAAILEHVHRSHEHQRDQSEFERRKPSTRKLVWGVRRLAEHMAQPGSRRQMVLPRLMANSLLDDGAFARSMLASFQRDLFPGLSESLEAARAAGDARQTNAPDGLQLWLVHHLLFGLRLLSLPPRDVVAYEASRAERIEWITRFALRGLGLHDDAIEREWAAVAK